MTNDVKRPEAIIREPKHAKLTATHLSRIQNGQIGDTVKAWDITLGKVIKKYSENVSSTDLGSLILNTQCGNFMIFLPLRFYVKSILVILKLQKLPF